MGGGSNLVSVLSLGHQVLTGAFLTSSEQVVTRGPLELVWCPESGLLQLAHSYDATEMYGANYGYRSGLNQSMVDHLKQKMRVLERRAALKSGDVVIDIGSNDCTFLKSVTTDALKRIGVDPAGEKFRPHYPSDIALIPDFFSAHNVRKLTSARAALITSIAMFYDLEDPIDFTRQVADVLAPEGLWHFEQSYMPSMLRMCAYDTICHEHVEYYSLSTVAKILDAADLRIVDVEMNAVNGGSFAVTATHKKSSHTSNNALINWLLEQEQRMGLDTPRPYRQFEERVYRHREDLKRLLQALTADNKKILGYGASTKGNVLLQFCGITEREVPVIAEINPDKFGALTPGTNIPIISETEARAMKPDYFFVLPWHFKDGILRRELRFRQEGGKFIFPLPDIEMI